MAREWSRLSFRHSSHSLLYTKTLSGVIIRLFLSYSPTAHCSITPLCVELLLSVLLVSFLFSIAGLSFLPSSSLSLIRSHPPVRAISSESSYLPKKRIEQQFIEYCSRRCLSATTLQKQTIFSLARALAKRILESPQRWFDPAVSYGRSLFSQA